MSKEEKRLFTASEGMKQEYCAEIVRIGEMKPIEGSDFLVQTMVDGFSIVVSKGEFTEGEPVIYCMNETALNKDFLSANNQFEIGLRDMNANAAEVNAIMQEYDEKYKKPADELRAKANYIKGSIEAMTKSIARYKKSLKKIEDKYDSYTDVQKVSADDEKVKLQHEIESWTKKIEESQAKHANLKKQIDELVNAGKPIVDEAKKHVGFFNKYGRVKLIELRGCPSYGVIFKKETLEKWNKKVADENLEDYLTVDENGFEHPFMFDTVGNKLFAEAYVPPIPQQNERVSKDKKRNKRLKKFKRIIPGEFKLHYDTSQLKQNMWRFTPETLVTVSVKCHGTSHISGNVHVRIPRQLTPVDVLHNRLLKRKARHIEKQHVRNPYTGLSKKASELNRITNKLIPSFKIDYGPVYSSRTVIKNDSVTKQTSNGGYYGVDIWTEYGEMLKKHIDKGMSVYGEICGYLTGSDKMIQKGYDYGCKRGENFLMPYRITWKHEDGTTSEWNVMEVYGWTLNLLKEHPELSDRIKPIQILYHGTLGNLYPDIDETEHWHENVLERMINDVEHFGMEQLEPLCNNKVPREGICVRIDDDVVPECFKLKTFAFLKKEQADIDAGNVDIEMSMAYGEDKA